MGPEEYAALKAAASVKLSRDAAGNYCYEANKATLGVLPRDCIQQLETIDKTEADTRVKRHADILAFIADLKAAK
jgi:hypothetical protein